MQALRVGLGRPGAAQVVAEAHDLERRRDDAERDGRLAALELAHRRRRDHEPPGQTGILIFLVSRFCSMVWDKPQ